MNEMHPPVRLVFLLVLSQKLFCYRFTAEWLDNKKWSDKLSKRVELSLKRTLLTMVGSSFTETDASV